MRHQVTRRAGDDDFAAGIAALGTEIDDPVRGADHVEVVLDDDQRVPGRDQLAQCAHQLGHVVEVQAGGGLVEEQQRSLACQLAADRQIADAGFRRLGEEPCNFQPLRLAARERRHRLAELHVFEAHVRQRLQHAHHFAIATEVLQRFADRQTEHLGHAQRQLAALDLHFEHFGTEALAVAVGAAQVHVGQELHLHVFEAVAAAGRAAAVAGVEAEHARGVIALDRQPRLAEQIADRIPRAHVTGGIGACGLADRRLIDHCHVGQPVMAEHAVERARRFGRFPLRLGERREQHVLDQRALARARHARDDHQVIERKLDRDVLQVVLARTFEHQPRRVGAHVARGVAVGGEHVQLELLAARQVLPGQCRGALDFVGRAIEDDLAAALARARSHVKHAVGREHHLRVVFDHHQRVARRAQPVHHLDHAMHVARVQADRGFVEDEQCVDERGAERSGQVDPLHLAAGQGAALPVERQVPQPDIAQELQPRAHFFEQQLGGFVHRAGEGQTVEERAHAVDRQQHHIVDRQAGQGGELGVGPRNVDGFVACIRRPLTPALSPLMGGEGA